MKVGDLVKFKKPTRHAEKVFLLAWVDDNGWARLIGDIQYDPNCASRVEDLEPVDNLGKILFADGEIK